LLFLLFSPADPLGFVQETIQSEQQRT
jgi:hypothetical protein